MKTPFLISISTLCVILLLSMAACKKNPTTYGTSDSFNNNTMTTATFLGQVVDKSGNPISGAMVRTGTHAFTSDQDGMFYFSKINTPQHATLLSASAAGYFKGFKTIKVNSDKGQHVLFMLESLGTPMSVNSAVGGNINFEGATVKFQPNAFVNKNTKMPYNGNVNVYARYIDPTESQFNLICPGSLRAINAAGRERILTSYGMMDVVMQDDAGNELQLATGKPSEINMPIPAGILANAPQTIPLWHLSETNGMWIEEGSAQKVGNVYVGNVTHFSNWNCDFPDDIIPVTFTVIDANNNPLSGVLVDITSNNANGHCGGRVDNNGFASVFLPPNQTFTMTVYPGNPSCPTTMYTTTISTTSSPLNLGSIVIPVASLTQVNVSGTVTDCNNNPTATGMVKIKLAGEVHVLACNPNGTFNSTFNSCSPLPGNANISAYDMSANQYATTNFTVNSGTNTLGTLNACGSNLNFINFTSIVGGIPTNYSLVDPTSTLIFDYNPPNTYLAGYNQSSNNFINFIFDGPQTSAGIHNLTSYRDHLDSANTITPTIVNITNYPGPGLDVEGNFSANVSGMNLGTRTINCAFKVKRP